MKTKLSTLAIAVLAVQAAQPSRADSPIAPEDMARHCAGMAAEEFGTNPRYILTLPPEGRPNGATSVYGQTPPEGSDVETFECRYGPHGFFRWVHRSGGSKPAPVAEADLARYCAGMASEKFEWRVREILTLPVEKDASGFFVFGQYPDSGTDVTTFTCAFGADRVLKSVKRDG